jgi:hypothetical protein
LEQTVIEAMHLAFAERRDFSEADLVAAASQVVPLSRTAREQLEHLQDSGPRAAGRDPRRDCGV